MIKLQVIGDPIGHSLSPEVHGKVLSAIGVDYEYTKKRVAPGELAQYIEYAKTQGITGFNLTMPHKVDVLEYLDYISPEAEMLSSVNTVCIKNGRLYGYNTDGKGFELSLNMLGYFYKGSKIVILGAGGVVRTLAISAVCGQADSVTIVNRTEEKAKEVCGIVRNATGREIACAPVGRLAECCSDADIFINATPLGMSGTDSDFEDFGFLRELPKHALVSDLIYNPPKTRLLAEAEKAGLKIHNGMGMLIFQAIIADGYYLDRKLDAEEIYRGLFF